MRYETIKHISNEKIVAVIRGKNADEALSVANAAIAGGIRLIELTYTTPNVERLFTEIDSTEVCLGAGTVLDKETARSALLNGAKFIVSPHFEPEIATLCNRYSILYVPGCMTIKEMVAALEFGCSLIKLFPATNYQPEIIKAIKGPLPNIEVMPTGGVNLTNIASWLNHGALAAGIGGDFTRAYREMGEQGVVKLVSEYKQAIRGV